MSKSDWFSWQQLLDRWGIQDFELFKEGLEPYKRPGKQRIFCPYNHHEYKRKLDQYEEVQQTIRVFRRLISREKELEAGTPIYLQHFDPIVDYLETIGGRDFQLKNGSICISDWEMDIVKTLKAEYAEELATIEKQMDAIVVDDSNLNDDQKHLSWKYFVVPPSDKEIKKLISELELEEAIFHQDNVLELEAELGLRPEKKKES